MNLYIESDSKLEFEPENHVYRVDGEELLSVTQILNLSGLIAWWYWKNAEKATQRGTNVHLATQYLDYESLDVETVDPELAGYLKAYQRFKDDVDFKIERIEYRAYHPTYRYAGTIDRVGKLNGETVIVDIKSGGKWDWHALQLAGYDLLLENKCRRYGLYLSNSGTYKLESYDNPRDIDVFLAALTVANWKNSGG